MLVQNTDCTTPLEIEVNGFIEDGWVPLGGVCVHTNPRDNVFTYYTQAMVKYEDIAELLSSGVTCLNCGKAKELKSMLVCPHVMANDNIDCHSGGI